MQDKLKTFSQYVRNKNCIQCEKMAKVLYIPARLLYTEPIRGDYPPDLAKKQTENDFKIRQAALFSRPEP